MNNEEQENERVYLYVHGFEWTDEEDGVQFEGHLKDGRVYQAEVEVLEGGEKLYKIELFKYKREFGLALTELTGTFPKWSCDIEVIDDEALLTLDINDEDMEMIAEKGAHAGVNLENEEQERMQKLIQMTGRNMLAIIKEDDDMFKVLALMIDTITRSMTSKTYVSFTDAVGLRPDDTGRLTNMVKTAMLLEQHLNSEDNDPSYLMEAMFTLLLEVKRTIEIK